MTGVTNVAAQPRELFGREAAFAAVDALLDASARGAALLLSGEPGLGKTAVLEAAAAAAADRGFSVLRARGDQFGAVSFDALRSLLHNMRHLRASISATRREALAVALYNAPGSLPGPLILLNAVLDMLTIAAHRQPVLLVVDDLQWLDQESAGVIGLLARRLTGRPLGFLATLRPDTSGFFESLDLPQFELYPLQADAARRALSAYHPDIRADVASRVLQEACGNPLALVELPSALTAGQRAQKESLPVVLPLTGRLRTVFSPRIAALPSSTRELLLLAALDDGADVRIHLAAADRELDDYASAETARLVTIDVQNHEISFRHPLARATVVDIASPDQIRQAHRSLAAPVGGVFDRRARHLAAAATGPDEDTATQLESEARRLLRGGDGVGAVDLLVKAAYLSTSIRTRRARLAAAAYVGADVTGDLELAATLLNADGAGDKDQPTLQAASAGAQVLLNGDGDIRTAHQLMEAALKAADLSDPAARDSIIEALHTLQLVNFFACDPSYWAPYWSAARLLPGPLPVTVDVSSRTFSDPVRLARVGHALDDLDNAIGNVAANDPVETIRLAHGAIYLDRLRGLRQPLWHVVHEGRAGRAAASGIQALMLLAFDNWFSGQWDETQLLATEGVSLCEKYGYRVFVWPGQLALSLVAAARGDGETVTRLTEQMLRWASPRGVRAVELYAWHARGLAALTQGEWETAMECANRVSPAGELASHVPHALWVALDLVEAASAAGHPDIAASHCAALVSERVDTLSTRMALVVAAAQAIAAASSPDIPTRRQEALFKSALAQPGVEQWPLEHARVQLAYGQALRRQLRHDDARPQLQAALRTFNRMGAQPWSLRAAEALRASGIPVPATASSSVGALTEQELEIAKLAAEGLTNRQIGERLFLSHRTVGSILYRAFPKLQVSTRAALRDALSGVV